MATAERVRTTTSDDALKHFVETALDRLGDEDTVRIVLEVDGSRLEVPTEAATSVLQILRLAASGHHLDVTALPDVLTTGQAADILGLSRPTVVALVDSGELPGERTGSHRRIRTVDLVAFRARRERSRHHELRELTRLSEELGLYGD